MVKMYIIQT